MSLTCHEEIARVGRVRRGSYEDASDLSATSRMRVVLVKFGERHDTRTNGRHYTADRRLTSQVSAWQAKRGSRPTRATFS